MGRFKSTAIAAAIALSGVAAANAPPPPPDREAPHDAVSTVHDTIAGLWEVRIESLVGPEAYPKTGTLDLTWSGRYFLNLTGSDGATTSEQGLWAVWEADEGGGFTLMLAPVTPGESDMIAFGPSGPQRAMLHGDGAGGYRGEATYGAHLRKIELTPR